MVTGPFTANSFMLLQETIAFWRELGYLFVDLPWVVGHRFVEATRPIGMPMGIETAHGVLVASGEQSFLQLMSESKLAEAPGYIGWTPCFREEPEFTALHHLGFLKAELFIPVESTEIGLESLQRLLDRQGELFETLAQSMNFYDTSFTTKSISALQTDIELNGVEIGSYGVRSFEGHCYLYGTALALPRFTQALRIRQLTPV
jgi:seryl-tRNA synthetase